MDQLKWPNGEPLELDDTISAAIAYLDSIGEPNYTQIIVKADHGHRFDVMGSVDIKFLNAQTTDREKRGAIGTYQNSVLSQYTVADAYRNNTSDSALIYTEGHHFPAN